MFYHIITTNTCNLNCKYCGEKAFHEPDAFPEELDVCDNQIKYSVTELRDFVLRDVNTAGLPKLTFYGGEPLMRVEFIKEVMNKLPEAEFYMQTNGLLLHRLPKEYVNKMKTILVSIDGDKKTTDENRGKGTYDKVIENIKLIRKNGFKGELIARMTLEDQDIFHSTLHLLSIKEIDSVHWQLDANFWFNDWKEREFGIWVDKNYIPNLKRLIDFWFDLLKKGRIIRLYPFIGIAHSLLFEDDPYLLKCGSGHSNYTIQTDGNISPCPIMIGMKRYYLGNIKDKKITELNKTVVSGKGCKECDAFRYCGARCLYSNILNPWPEEHKAFVCKTVKVLIAELNQRMPTIKNLIEQNIINESDFIYVKYSGPEIVP